MTGKWLLLAPCLLLGLTFGPATAQDARFMAAGYPAADPVGGWHAGVEATFLRPHRADSGPITFQNDNVDLAFGALAELDSLEGAPRVWLGYRGEAWGVRGRYWLYDANTAGTFQEIESDTVFRFASAMQLLSAKTADLEGTRCFCFGNWNGDLFFGARWAEIERNGLMNYNDIDLGTDLFDPSQQGSRSIASGVGFTFGLDGRRPIGDWGLAMVFNARGSVLWGDRSSYVYQTYAESGVLAAQFQGADDTGTLWIAELQAGLEWSGPLRYVNAEVFTHLVFEYQFWNSVDQPRLLSEQSINGTDMVVGSLGSSVDFVGVAWAIGFRR